MVGLNNTAQMAAGEECVEAGVGVERDWTGDVVGFAREKLGVEPDGLQEELLRCEGRQVILNCSRQWGKSTMAAVKAVHRAWTVAGATVIVASPSERQSAELMVKARELAGRLGVRPRGDGHNRVSLRFDNGSRIVGLPGNETTVRGFSAVSLLILDEAARAAEALYRCLRPMLACSSTRTTASDAASPSTGLSSKVLADTTEPVAAGRGEFLPGLKGRSGPVSASPGGAPPPVRSSGGELWMLSTPRGKQGFFWEAWELGGEDWRRFEGPANECGRISGEWLEAERRSMGETWFRQEYLCEFVSTGAELFDREAVLGVVDNEGGWWG